MDEVEVVAIKAKRVAGQVREIGECFLLKRRDARTAIALKLVIPVSRDQSAPADVLAADMPIETSAAPEAPEAPEAPAEPQNAAAGLNEEHDMPTETDAAAVAQDRADAPAATPETAEAEKAAPALEDKQMSAERVKRPYKRRDMQAQP